METRIFRQRCRIDADAELGLDQRMRLAVVRVAAIEPKVSDADQKDG